MSNTCFVEYEYIVSSSFFFLRAEVRSDVEKTSQLESLKLEKRSLEEQNVQLLQRLQVKEAQVGKEQQTPLTLVRTKKTPLSFCTG